MFHCALSFYVIRGVSIVLSCVLAPNVHLRSLPVSCISDKPEGFLSSTLVSKWKAISPDGSQLALDSVAYSQHCEWTYRCPYGWTEKIFDGKARCYLAPQLVA